MANIHIVGLAGSLGEKSTSLSAVNTVLNHISPVENFSTTLLDLSLLDLPMYAPGHEKITSQVEQFVAEIRKADAMVWASPLYHGSVSGLFKNAIDWLELLAKEGYLANKPVGLVGVAGGIQAMQSVNAMEMIVRALRGWTIPYVVPINRSWQLFDDAGNCTDPKTAQMLENLARQVIKASTLFAPRIDNLH